MKRSGHSNKPRGGYITPATVVEWPAAPPGPAQGAEKASASQETFNPPEPCPVCGRCRSCGR